MNLFWALMTKRRKRQDLRASLEEAANAAAAALEGEGRRARGEPLEGTGAAEEVEGDAACACAAAELVPLLLLLPLLLACPSVSSCVNVRRLLLSLDPPLRSALVSPSSPAPREGSSAKTTLLLLAGVDRGVEEDAAAEEDAAGAAGAVSGIATTSTVPSARNRFWMLSMRNIDARFFAALAAASSSGVIPA